MELFPEVVEWEKKEKARRRQEFLDSLPYFPTPQNDNEKMLNFQKELLSGSRRAEKELWTLAIKVAERMVRKEAKEHQKILDPEEVYDKAMEAVEYVLRRYRKTYRDGRLYAVTKNYISAIYNGVRHAMWIDWQKHRGKVRIIVNSDLLLNFERPDDIVRFV
jgi:hypothetical protein